MLLFRLRDFRASLVDPRQVISAAGTQTTPKIAKVRLLTLPREASFRSHERRRAFLSVSKFLFVLSPGDASWPPGGEVGISINSRRKGTRATHSFAVSRSQSYLTPRSDGSALSESLWRLFFERWREDVIAQSRRQTRILQSLSEPAIWLIRNLPATAIGIWQLCIAPDWRWPQHTWLSVRTFEMKVILSRSRDTASFRAYISVESSLKEMESK